MDATELCFTPATRLSELIDSREVSPVEITQAVLERIEHLNPVLNAFLTVTPELALQQAREAETRAMQGQRRGPLDGIPGSIKDLEPVAGIRTTYGSKFFENNIPLEDGAVAGRMRSAGVVLLGKTNTPHFGHKDMCDNLLGPPARNPWRLDRTSGASSGGAGVSVAAGLGPIAHGSDGAGSIRIPSALCGVFGLKPSLGRVPYWPSADLWAARSHAGPMTRTVRDAALLLQVMAGPDERDPLSIDGPPDNYLAACDGDLKGLRVVWSADFGYAAVDPEVRQTAEAAARRFVELGATVEERDPGWTNPDEFHRVIYEVSVGARQADRATERPDWIEPSLMAMIDSARGFSAIDHSRALLERTVFCEQARKFFDTCDLLLTPQMPLGAWAVDRDPEQIGGRPSPTMYHRLPFTFPFNLTGQPAANVPCGFTSEGLPIGLQIVGRWHADALVMRAAAAFESLQPWAQHRPQLESAPVAAGGRS